MKDQFKNIHKGILSGIAIGFNPICRSMAAHAMEIEELEYLIVKHRGKEKLDELKTIGKTTFNSYQGLIENEANKIRRELICKSL